LGSQGAGSFEAEDTRRDRKACVEATQGAVAGHPSDGEDMKTSKSALEGLVSLVIRKGYFRLSVASILKDQMATREGGVNRSR
jgi:hypothetical protein